MRILFIADPLESFKTYKDTTFAIMQQMHYQGWQLFFSLAEDISVQNHTVVANVVSFDFIENQDKNWFKINKNLRSALKDFDAVIMRTDPPFNMQYLYATHLLSLAEKQGAKVFNSGQSMRDFNEKLAILNFAQYTPETIITTRQKDIRDFLENLGDIIVKPLDGMGGMGVFRLQKNAPNVSGILEMLMNRDQSTIMAQQYLPQIVEGDKRVLVIAGKVMPYTLARIPQNGETRANLAAGGKGVAMPITQREKSIAENLAPQLMARGIFLAGLDMIGGYLTEINVTSPTCFQEISAQTDCNPAKIFVEELEKIIRE